MFILLLFGFSILLDSVADEIEELGGLLHFDGAFFRNPPPSLLVIGRLTVRTFELEPSFLLELFKNGLLLSTAALLFSNVVGIDDSGLMLIWFSICFKRAASSSFILIFLSDSKLKILPPPAVSLVAGGGVATVGFSSLDTIAGGGIDKKSNIFEG